ncbi:glyoxylase-like metal-dependent hydrolase (beta-lactamase superfamily II) [Alicyclobacillus sacchari]|uniref:Glyoxylase-like metal-dependent hydrolase (Beta-lactamase superfamily II) n=1 Tax=Alicyclobacillus sacchari TaxID=392010 RepID=A0A4R8LLA4_9BACL|nr:MBL fold metallo-hydrolase [Alicyclobacillus sacchari]TDY45318.1 glyoxylase-like metal-dependent hydrolase (beta-lactamase superfamily II) [Alicyclobacillus sacchari]
MTQQLRASSAAEVYERMLGREPLFILDVRNEDAYADWRIEGTSITSLNVPYFDLLDGVDSVLGKLPEDVPILVVCAKEGSSKFVAEQLVEAGVRNVAYLAGGMQAWSEYLHPVKIGDLDGGGTIYQFVRVGKGCLSYAIVSDGEAAIVDPARMIDVYLQFAKEQGVSIRYAIDTHLHADHISGGRRLADAVGATYLLPPKDATEAAFVFTALEEGNTMTVGRSVMEIIPVYSPGHTIGSTSLIVDQKYLLTGDILFVASIGRPDLAGKAGDWAPDLRNTLYQTYRQLSPDLWVLPAHYSAAAELDDEGRVCARLGELYRVNPGLRIEDEAAFRKAVTENLPPQPNAYQDIRLTNMGKLEPSDAQASEMEIGPNRCAIHG